MVENLDKVEFEYWNGSDYIKGIIAGHEFDLGITGVRKDNHKKLLFCLHGPSSIKLKKPWGEGVYENLFEKFTEAIKDGHIKFFEIDYWANKFANSNCGGKVLIENCPFNQ